MSALLAELSLRRLPWVAFHLNQRSGNVFPVTVAEDPGRELLPETSGKSILVWAAHAINRSPAKRNAETNRRLRSASEMRRRNGSVLRTSWAVASCWCAVSSSGLSSIALRRYLVAEL